MVYKVSLKKRAIKALEKINEPYFSNIKLAIYSLAENPRPAGYKKLKEEMVYVFVLAITALFTMYSTMNFW